MAASAAVACPPWLQGICAWIQNPNIPCNQQWGRWCPGAPGAAEGGVDLSSPVGTPVFALGTGPLIGYGWDNYGGGTGWVLSQRVNVPGYGTNDIYYQHMTLSPKFQNAPLGTIVHKGEQIGTVGGWFQEVEVGFNPGWGGPWGDPSNRPGPWANDPRPMILALMGGGGTGITTSGNTVTNTGTVNLVSNQPTSPTQCAPWDVPCIVSQLVTGDLFQRGAIVFFGLILLLVGILVVTIGHGAQTVKNNPEILAAA